MRTSKKRKTRIPKSIETPEKESLDNSVSEKNWQRCRDLVFFSDEFDDDFATKIAEIEAIRNEEYELVLQQMANEAEDDR